MKNLNQYIQEKYLIDVDTKVRDLKNWTITDAEDGDIVVCNDSVYFIYKCLNGEHPINNTGPNVIVVHACYIPDERKKLYVGIDTGVGDISKPRLFKLANDKQCKEFYDALKKHGYKWDDNKKEIVKI